MSSGRFVQPTTSTLESSLTPSIFASSWFTTPSRTPVVSPVREPRRLRPPSGAAPPTRARKLTQTAAVATAQPHRVGARRDMDRRALVERANVIVTRVDPRAALTVGNGQTAFTADVTGLQTLNSTYVSPPLQMQTHADFGWHTTPPPTGVIAIAPTAEAPALKARGRRPSA